MSWVTPKTDWGNPLLPEYRFNASPDWERITGNLNYLRDAIRPIVGEITWQNMITASTATILYVDDYNAVENNLESLANTFNIFGIPKKEPQFANTPVWDNSDLNRIESLTLDIYNWINRIKGFKNTLPFMLGVGEHYASYL